ncbi:MAG: hypothetical protein K2Q22_00340 [Cytophagales bacterium]|nr:hypothetical protein [Cytophagales bacterium]
MDNKLTFKQSITAGAIAAGASVVINSILFFVFHAAGVISDTVFVQPNQPLTVVPVIISSILPTLIGATVFFLIEKYTNNAFKIFQIVAIVLVVLSFSSPFMAVQGMPIAYGIVLNVMHVVVAYSLVFFIGRAKK